VKYGGGCISAILTWVAFKVHSMNSGQRSNCLMKWCNSKC